MQDQSLDSIWQLTPGGSPAAGAYDQFGESANSSAFEVAEAARISTTAAHVASRELGRQRGLESPPPVLSRSHAMDSFTGHIRVDGQPLPAWADLSGAYRTGDNRWIQLHCNFPHHAEGAAAALGVGLDRSAFERAILEREAVELETELIDRGMIGAAYRTMGEWNEHPHAEATLDLPLLSWEQIGDADPANLGGLVDRSMDGVRVMDCSRVLAGPVAGQTLASSGADVLRIGAAHLPRVEVGVVSTGFGKRNTHIDLRTRSGAETFEGLLSDAHVLVDAYRPGALEGHGFSLDRLAEIRPGIVVVQICAFDWIGPWAGRRGFDSIVQSTTGIAMAGSWGANRAEDQPPVHLPVQVLDYATGFLAAHAAARLVCHQQLAGGSWLARLSLLRTRNWFVGLGGPHLFDPIKVTADEGSLFTLQSSFGELEAVRPMTGRWDLPPSELGSAPAAWS